MFNIFRRNKKDKKSKTIEWEKCDAFILYKTHLGRRVSDKQIIVSIKEDDSLTRFNGVPTKRRIRYILTLHDTVTSSNNITYTFFKLNEAKEYAEELAVKYNIIDRARNR